MTAHANPNRGRIRGERLEARITADQKSLIEHAAALQGRTVTDFVLTSVQDAARRAKARRAHQAALKRKRHAAAMRHR